MKGLQSNSSGGLFLAYGNSSPKVIIAGNVCTFSNDTHPFRILSPSS